ncbi:MAG TPA: ergothioneine biosynthesis protein EgtB [Acidimicrobiales bacterium]|nr:ergothioneine biosynthesis protein EgtB [Acidimicrobiales bacterium]
MLGATSRTSRGQHEGRRRADAQAAYCEVRACTEELAAPLGPEDQTVQSMPDVSPTKWHRAHVTWFFEEFVLDRFVPGYRRVHPAHQYLFNSYYEAVGERHPRAERGLLSRPTAAQVGTYRRAVDQAMLELLDTSLPDEASGLVELGLHHEQQHQELLLMDAKHVLSQGPLDPVYRRTSVRPSGEAAPLGWAEHPGGIVEVGHDGEGFAYDNEGPRHRVLLEPFALAHRPVTAGEWLAFIDDGGYHRPELWLSEGWGTVQGQGWEAPLYWQRERGEGWSLFTLSGRRPVDPAEPVCHVSYFEADAYARWAGARLPTEAEWEAVAAEVPVTDEHLLDLDSLHPRPATEPGLAQLYGGVWEWTASPYTPYPGFTPGPGAVGEYNGKFMVNQQVLRGGCCATPRGHVRPTYRNFFPASARWAFAGLRLARGASA